MASRAANQRTGIQDTGGFGSATTDFSPGSVFEKVAIFSAGLPSSASAWNTGHPSGRPEQTKIGSVAALRWFFYLIVASNLIGQTAIYPLKDVRTGQHGIGRTIFSGNKVEEFQVEILGVLENLGPKQSIILARLSGGPLEQTGVMQGMSGSPVYIDGRLVGAVALGFSFAKEPIAGIRPIEEMLAVSGQSAAPASLARA